MKPLHLAIVAAISIALTMPVAAQDDAIGAPGPIMFEETQFDLAWTSNPTETYYKQEYVPDGQAVEAYAEMFMIDLLTAGATPQSAAAEMVAGLEQRKGSDPVVNFELIANEATGEIILDFLLSDSSSGITIVEWNAYRYVPHGDGLALFAISRRGYGATEFIRGLGEWRRASIEALAMMELPQLVVD